MPMHIGVLMPLRKADVSDVLTSVYVRQIDDDEPRILCHAQRVGSFLLPRSFPYLRQEDKNWQGAILTGTLDDALVCPGKNFLAVWVDPFYCGGFIHLFRHAGLDDNFPQGFER